MKKIKPVFILLLLPIFIFGQEATSTPPDGRNVHPEILSLYDIAMRIQFDHSKIDSFLNYFEQIGRLAKVHNDSFMIGESAVALNGYYNMKGDYAVGFRIVNEALPYSKDPPQLAQLLNNKAYFIQKNKPIEAEKLYRASIKLAEKFKISGASNARHSYASFLKNQGRFYESAIQIEKAVRSTKSQYQKTMMFRELAELLLAVNNFERAEEYLNESIRVSEQENFRERNGQIALLNAQIQIHKKNFDGAREEIERTKDFKAISNQKYFEILHFKAKHSLFNSTGIKDSVHTIINKETKRHVLNSFYFLEAKSILLLQQNKPLEALKTAEKYLRGTQRNPDVREEVKARYILSQIYMALSQPGFAYTELSKKTKLDDSLKLSRQEELVHYVEAQYKRKEQDQTISVLDGQNQMKEVQLAQQRKILIGGAISLALISMLSFFLFRLYKKVNQQKDQLGKAVRQKDTLLREIHHRVKNNLQLVSSLLTLQSRSIDDQVAVDAINAGKSRVRSMALIHQDLYNRVNLTGIGLKNYLEKLTTELFNTYHVQDKNIQLKMDIEDLELDVDTIIPLGLIINELVTNALKYAFENQEFGEISISLKEIKQQLILHVKDNGQGVTTGVKQQSKSFGNKLVATLSEQLEGTIERINNDGMEIILKINEYKKAA